MLIRLSARSSALAQLQAFEVGEVIRAHRPQCQVEFQFRESLGDKNLTDPLWKMPAKGVFTEDFVKDLLEGKTDIVVHSWKDLPTERHPDLEILLTLSRADQRDVLLLKKTSWERLSQIQTVKLFSSSQRRIYHLRKFLKWALPHSPQEIVFKDVRGNIPTRLKKTLEDNEIDGIIVAKAAMDRLLTTSFADLQSTRQQLQSWMGMFQWMVLPLQENPNAAAQGALAIEYRRDRKEIRESLEGLNVISDYQCVQREREILSQYGGGCHQKIGISVLERPYGRIEIVKGESDSGEKIDVCQLFRPAQELEDIKNTFKLLAVNQKAISGDFTADDFSTSTSTLSDFTVRRAHAAQVERAREELGSAKAVYVAKFEAAADLDLQNFKGVVWTSGLATWKKLAQKNVWVHGSSESLGEKEDPRMETLLNVPSVRWIKLTHDQARTEDSDENSVRPQTQAIGTYQMQLQPGAFEQLNKKIIYWTSSYFFEQYRQWSDSQNIQEQRPKPRWMEQIHCCGVGGTADSLVKILRPYGLKPLIFLNEKEWRNYVGSIDATL